MDEELRGLEREILEAGISPVLLKRLKAAWRRSGHRQASPPTRLTRASVEIPTSLGPLRPVRQPLWDKEIVAPGYSSWVHFFRNARSFTNGGSKTPSDTNLPGTGSELVAPIAAFAWSALSLVPASGSRPRDLDVIWNEGKIVFSTITGHLPRQEWPCSLLMTEPFDLPLAEDGTINMVGTIAPRLDVRVPVRVVRRESNPVATRVETQIRSIVIEARHEFGFALELPRPVESRVMLMLVMHGTQFRSPALA